jgi:hypothetical protein
MAGKDNGLDGGRVDSRDREARQRQRQRQRASGRETERQRDRETERDRERGREGDAIEETDLKNGATETTEVRWCRWLEEPAGGGGEPQRASALTIEPPGAPKSVYRPAIGSR